MSVDPRLPTPSEFVACKLRQGSKHQFRAGAIYAMAGATDDHIQTVTNLVAIVRPPASWRTCRIYASDMMFNFD